MRDQARFWDKVAKRYAAKPIEDVDAYERKLELTRELLKPDMSVLEIGCGTGATAIKLAPYVSQIDAFDISSAMLQFATQRAQEANVENVRFEQSSIESINLPDHQYDVILAHSILHLLSDVDATVIQIKRWLKPGGLFISNTICIAEVNPAIRCILPIVSLLGLAPLLNVFSRASLENTIKGFGFDINHKWALKHGVFLIAMNQVSSSENKLDAPR